MKRSWISYILIGSLWIVQVAMGDESKPKTQDLFNQYLDVIHTRYIDDSGSFSPTLTLMPRDIKNINELTSQYFGTQTLTAESTAKNAEFILLSGIKQLNDNSHSSGSSHDLQGIKLREIHIKGENDPKLEHIATLTKVQGQVELLTNPVTKIITEDANLKYAKFDGKYYSYKHASISNTMKSGDIIRIGSTKGSKARLVFNNGDHIELGSNSAFRMLWAQVDQKLSSPSADLLYGKIRLVVKKGGPRKKLKVSTRAAVLGVRGTDFYLDDKSDKTKIIVMRGKVNVKPKSDKIKELDIPAGFTASVPTPVDKVAPSKELSLQNFDQNELNQLDAMVDNMKKSPDPSSLPNDSANLAKVQPSDLNMVQEVAAAEEPSPPTQNDTPESLLEEKAFQMVLSDLVNENPESISKIKKLNLRTVDQLNALSIELLK